MDHSVSIPGWVRTKGHQFLHRKESINMEEIKCIGFQGLYTLISHVVQILGKSSTKQRRHSEENQAPEKMGKNSHEK